MNGARWNISTLAGSREGNYDASFTNSKMTMPYAIAFSPAGDLYFADRSNKSIRKLDMKRGMVETVATNGLASPTGLFWSNSGYFFVCDRSTHKVYTMDVEGNLNVLAGGDSGFKDGDFETANFCSPCSVTVGSNGIPYISDCVNDRIRGLNMAKREVFTLTGDRGGHVDGPLNMARFFRPWGICSSSYLELFVCDWGNNRIRLVDLARGKVTTLNPLGEPQLLDCPISVVMTPQSDILIADRNHHAIKVLTRPETSSDDSGNPSTSHWKMTTFAGPTSGFVDGNCATEAQLIHPTALEFHPDGSLFIGSNQCIRVAKQMEQDVTAQKKLDTSSTSIGVLLETSTLSDYTFVSASGRQWQLHKVILAYRFPKFLNNNFSELTVSDDAWQSFFDFVYIDSFSEPPLVPTTESFNFICDLWKQIGMIAHAVQSSPIQDFCTRRIRDLKKEFPMLQAQNSEAKSSSHMVGVGTSSDSFDIGHLRQGAKPEKRQFSLPGGALFSQLSNACNIQFSPGEMPSEYVSRAHLRVLVPYDFTIIIDGKLEFPVHKAILWARWPYFRFMMDSGMAEANSSRLELGGREQSGLDVDAWLALFYFFYSDSPIMFFPNTALQLLSCSDMYRITTLGTINPQIGADPETPELQPMPGFDHLIDTCKSLIDILPTIEGAIELHHLSMDYGNAKVLNNTRKTILAHLPDIFKDQALKSKFEELDLAAKYSILEEAFGKLVRSGP